MCRQKISCRVERRHAWTQKNDKRTVQRGYMHLKIPPFSLGLISKLIYRVAAQKLPYGPLKLNRRKLSTFLFFFFSPDSWAQMHVTRLVLDQKSWMWSQMIKNWTANLLIPSSAFLVHPNLRNCVLKVLTETLNHFGNFKELLTWPPPMPWQYSHDGQIKSFSVWLLIQQNQFNIDLIFIQSRFEVNLKDSKSIWRIWSRFEGFEVDLKSIQSRFEVELKSIRYQFYIDLISIQHQFTINLTSICYQFKIDCRI